MGSRPNPSLSTVCVARGCGLHFGASVRSSIRSMAEQTGSPLGRRSMNLFPRIENADAAPPSNLQPAVAALWGLTAIVRSAPLPAASEKIDSAGVAALVCARAPLQPRTFDPGIARGRCCRRLHLRSVTLHCATFQASISCRQDSIQFPERSLERMCSMIAAKP